MVKFDEFEKIIEQNALNCFLKTSLNTELVITILKGILILAASSSDKIDHMGDQDMYRIKQTTTIELEKIKVKNASRFDLNEHGEVAKEDASQAHESGALPSPMNTRILESDTEDEDANMVGDEESNPGQ